MDADPTATLAEPPDWHSAMPTESEPYDGSPFRPLGHTRGRHFFSTRRGGQVRDFSARDLANRAILLELAPLLYWQREYQAKTEAFDATRAANALIEASYRAGLYNPDRIRGRGVWIDAGGAVAHWGDRLIAGGENHDPAEYRGEFLYERATSLDVDIAPDPLRTSEAAKLLDLCRMCPWDDRDSMGRLFAGWIVVAQVCGALPWRPHLWITSEAGGGKTWVVDNIVRPVLGGLALAVQSKTTEPGLRGALGLDARPVIFDEAESQNARDRERMQQVLDLARQASSEDAAPIIKGKSGGDGINLYRIRSCFVFSSINVGLSQAADESRTIVLSLAHPPNHADRQAHFAELKRLHAQVITADFGSRLLARTLLHLPTLRKNAETFALAIARTGVSRRTGDTLGVPLAGANLLRSTREVTPAEADELVATMPWVRAAVERADTTPEWQRALDHLLQHRVRTTNANGRVDDTPIGELIATAATQADFVAREANVTLGRIGLRVGRIEPKEPGSAQVLLLANGSADIPRIFADTPWAAGFRETLSRVPGAVRPRRNYQIGAGSPGKALAVPIAAVLRGAD